MLVCTVTVLIVILFELFLRRAQVSTYRERVRSIVPTLITDVLTGSDDCLQKLACVIEVNLQNKCIGKHF